MNLLIENTFWMGLNIFLAATPILLGIFILITQSKLLKILGLFLFLLFVPNTLYIITDLLHLPKQIIKVQGIEKIILIIQYFILEICGILTFILSLYFFKKILIQFKLKSLVIILTIMLNFAIGFGIVLGRILRLNSWDIFIGTEKVIKNSFEVLSSAELFSLALMFGVFGNALYFLTRRAMNKFGIEKIFNLKS